MAEDIGAPLGPVGEDGTDAVRLEGVMVYPVGLFGKFRRTTTLPFFRDSVSRHFSRASRWNPPFESKRGNWAMRAPLRTEKMRL